MVESSSAKAELGSALETNCIDSGGAKIIASDVQVAATLETDVLGAGEGVTAVEQMH
jgi:hypothetical protein